MLNLYFPQLLSGALAQYPLRKSRQIRTVKNVYADGSLTAWPDSGASLLQWDLTYRGLSSTDLETLQNFFTSCSGPYQPFTFIDPTDNMLAASANIASPGWQLGPGIEITANLPDPLGGIAAVHITNTGQAQSQIAQTLQVPGNYQYCFSAYVMGNQPSTVTLSREAGLALSAASYQVTDAWERIVSSGRLNDTGTSLTVSLALAPGQQIQVFGVQLEAQVAPSRYSATAAQGGIYPNAHWASSSFASVAEGPGSFTTSFSVQTLL